ncbi:MAG: hypothetical protein SFY81_06070 [Verrucomicrobiota bacterium]|nr:hypothetical protein [Verrucomicrobiota bacterium]
MNHKLLGLFYTWMVLVTMVLSGKSNAASTVLYQTGFEFPEFNRQFTLANQGGWVASGDGEAGILTNAFVGQGQQAYIGFYLPPASTNDFTTVWRPVNYNPAGASAKIVKFKVEMEIVPSSNQAQDDFRWSAYNSAGTRLFSLDFETSTGNISYLLDDDQFVFTNFRFDHTGSYDLEIWMDFQRNYWVAFFNNVLVVPAVPITTKNSILNFGDMDAVWFIRNINQPGDNYMIFDNYTVTAESIPSIPAYVEAVGHNTSGNFTFYIFGTPGINYRVDYTTNLVDWPTHGTYLMPTNSYLLFEDDTVANQPHRFYRAVAQ